MEYGFDSIVIRVSKDKEVEKVASRLFNLVISFFLPFNFIINYHFGYWLRNSLIYTA